MAVLLDTSQVPPDRRTAAVADAIEFSGVPTRVVHNCPGEQVRARLEYFTMGENHILTSQNSPQGLIKTPVLLTNADSDVLVIGLRLAGDATHTHAPGRLLRAGDIFSAQLWRPYEYFADSGETAAFHIPLGRLGLPRDCAVRSGELVHVSPLARQLRRHLQILFRDADAISQGPAAPMVAQATTDLVRAALISAIGEEPSRHDGWQQSLTTVVKSYIAQHLADPNLGAERIAQATFISVRQLYKLWETEPRPLGQWITERRLEAACDDLTSTRRSNQTIATIARRWGFADATHFSRRFRQAYRMSPREWRHAYRSSAAMNGSTGPGKDGSVHA